MNALTAAVVDGIGIVAGLWVAVFGFNAGAAAYRDGYWTGVLVSAVLWAFGVYAAYASGQGAARNWNEYRAGEGGK